MAKNKGRKSKRKYIYEYPPLGVLDYIIYTLIFLLIFFIAISPLIIIDRIQKAIAFSNPNIIAADKDNASLLFSLPLFFSFLLLVGVPGIVILFSKECPIIGKIRDFKKTNPFKTYFLPHVKEIYFDIKNFVMNKRILISGLIFILLFLSLMPFSFFARTTLSEDFTIEKYNIINKNTETYYPSDFDNLIIDVYSSNSRSGTTYGFAIEIVMENGESIYLHNYQFKNVENKIDYVLDKMLKIKSLFSNDKIEIRDYNKLNRVIKELDLNVSQINKLNELFSTP